MAKRSETLQQMIERLGRDADKAAAEAAADNTVDPWDLLSLDPAEAAAAWTRLQRGARLRPPP
jgi:hypothetical protein